METTAEDKKTMKQMRLNTILIYYHDMINHIVKDNYIQAKDDSEMITYQIKQLQKEQE